MTSANSIHKVVHSKLVLCDKLKGWGGEGGGRGVQDSGTYVYPWLIHVNVSQKLPQHYKVASIKINK